MKEKLQKLVLNKEFETAEKLLLSVIMEKLASKCMIEIEENLTLGKFVTMIPQEKKEYRKDVRRLLALMEEKKMSKEYIIELMLFYDSL